MTLDQLSKIAEAATPGPWKQIGGGIDSTRIETDDGIYRIVTGGEKPYEVGEFIATFNPQTVKQLIARVEGLSAALRELAFEEGITNWDATPDRKEVFLTAREALAQFGPEVEL